MEEKNILIGITGGIASYKVIEVIRVFKKLGANIRVIMTSSATKFVTPLTFQEISGNPVIINMFERPKTWNIEHICLAKWADLLVIVPATANIIGKIASGIANDMLTTVVTATQAKVIIFPAMNSNMYLNSIVQKNIENLKKYGYEIYPPDNGLLACGTVGPGRLPEPLIIINKIKEIFKISNCMKRKKIIITAGATREAIDPIRFISNRSSGKMGYALAKIAAKRGANVILISGSQNIIKPQNIVVKIVETALEMQNAVFSEYENADIVIKAAAVADYRPTVVSTQKIKKTDENITISLTKNPDILKELGYRKKNQILIGFAAETENFIFNAQKKLLEKNLDMIIVNDIKAESAGFEKDTNIVKIIYKSGKIEDLPLMTKENLAGIILDKINELK